MNTNVHQGLHGEGFVHALACAGGFTTSRMNLDHDGVDLQVACPGPRGTIRSPKIEFQIKSSSRTEVKGDALHHRLKAKHFNHLAGPGFQVPRFLALVIVPSDVGRYAICTEEVMRLSTAAYWLSLAEQDEVPSGPDERKTVAVRIPRRNLLTVESLSSLLTGDLKGGAA